MAVTQASNTRLSSSFLSRISRTSLHSRCTPCDCQAYKNSSIVLQEYTITVIYHRINLCISTKDYAMYFIPALERKYLSKLRSLHSYWKWPICVVVGWCLILHCPLALELLVWFIGMCQWLLLLYIQHRNVGKTCWNDSLQNTYAAFTHSIVCSLWLCRQT